MILKAMEILVVKWKLNFLSKEKLCDMWSNPLPGIYHLQVLMYLQRIVLMSYFKKWKQMGKGKFTNIGFAMVESHVQIRENPKASRRCNVQSLSFHLKQNAVVVYMYIAFGQKLRHKDCSLLCNKTVLWGSTLET